MKKSATDNEKSDPKKAVNDYIELSKFYNRINSDSVTFFGSKALSLALSIGDKELIVRSWCSLSDAKESGSVPVELTKALESIGNGNYPLLKALVYCKMCKYEPKGEQVKYADSVILAYKDRIASLSEEERVSYALLLFSRAKAGFLYNELFKSKGDMKFCVDVLKKAGNRVQYLNSMYYYTQYLVNNFNDKKAATEACYIAIEEAKGIDNVVLYLLESSKLGYILKNSGLSDKAENIYLEVIALSTLSKFKDKPFYGSFRLASLTELHFIEAERKNYDKAIEYLKESIKYADNDTTIDEYNTNYLYAIEARINLAATYGDLNQHEKAYEVFKELLNRQDVQDDALRKAIIECNTGLALTKIKRFKEAIFYLNNSKPIFEYELGWAEKAELYTGFKDAYKGLRQYDSSTYYSEQLQIAKDSVFNYEKQIAFLDVVKKYDNEKLTAENKILTAEAEMSKAKEWLYWSVIGFIIVLGFVGFKVFQNERKLTVKQQELLNVEKENSSIQLAAKEAEEAKFKIELELKAVKEQEIQVLLDFKSRETISMATVALQNANLLVEIQGIVKGINGNQEENNRIMREVNSLINNQKHLEAFWDTFRRYFQEVRPRFFEILEERHPKLTLNDHKVCAYLVLGMSTNEISLLQNIEPRSFLRTRQRLKEKMGLESSEEIEVYLNSLA